jgi:cytochrome c oxidase subunit IV
MAQHSPADSHTPTEHSHPGPLRYVQIAVILCVITGIEVAVYYVPALTGALIPILLALSAVKFSIVVMWYMHLRFDAPIFSAIFVGGLLLAGSVLIALIFLFLSGAVTPTLDGVAPQH